MQGPSVARAVGVASNVEFVGTAVGATTATVAVGRAFSAEANAVAVSMTGSSVGRAKPPVERGVMNGVAWALFSGASAVKLTGEGATVSLALWKHPVSTTDIIGKTTIAVHLARPVRADATGPRIARRTLRINDSHDFLHRDGSQNTLIACFAQCHTT